MHECYCLLHDKPFALTNRYRVCNNTLLMNFPGYTKLIQMYIHRVSTPMFMGLNSPCFSKTLPFNMYIPAVGLHES